MDLKDIQAFVMMAGDKLVTHSLKVARDFAKRHDNVLRDYERLDCSDEFNLLNYEEIEYVDDRGRLQRMIEMTKDGFLFLVMGYRGKKAVGIKEYYIKAFNSMRDYIEGKRQSDLEELMKWNMYDMHTFKMASVGSRWMHQRTDHNQQQKRQKPSRIQGLSRWRVDAGTRRQHSPLEIVQRPFDAC